MPQVWGVLLTGRNRLISPAGPIWPTAPSCWPPVVPTCPGWAIAPCPTLGLPAAGVAAATLAHLRALPEGEFVYHPDQGKPLQDGPRPGSSPNKPPLSAVVVALRAWLDAAGLTEGGGGRVRVERVGSALSDRAIALIIHRRAAIAGRRRAQPALGLHHRRGPPKHCPARPDGNDRSSLRRQPSRLPPRLTFGRQCGGAATRCGVSPAGHVL